MNSTVFVTFLPYCTDCTLLHVDCTKGGSDFDPKGKSDGEIRRFCESFMTQVCSPLEQILASMFCNLHIPTPYTIFIVNESFSLVAMLAPQQTFLLVILALVGVK